MAVYRRTYRRYTGPLTPAWSRLLVLPRFAFMDLVQSRPHMILLVVCAVPPLAEAAIIYGLHNATALALLSITLPKQALINSAFFLRCLTVQGFLAFVLAAWVGPTLVAPDLSNGGLGLMLSRPLSRAEYVTGKLLVLVSVLSLVTWMPGLLLFALQAGLEKGWLLPNLRIAGALLAGSAIWILVLSLLALALSAWLRRRLTASLLMIGLFFGGTAFGEVWREMLRNTWGRLLNLTYLIHRIWAELFGAEMLPPRMERLPQPPIWAAWLALVTICAVSLWLLDRRVRAKEIVA